MHVVGECSTPSRHASLRDQLRCPLARVGVCRHRRDCLLSRLPEQTGPEWLGAPSDHEQLLIKQRLEHQQLRFDGWRAEADHNRLERPLHGGGGGRLLASSSGEVGDPPTPRVVGPLHTPPNCAGVPIAAARGGAEDASRTRSA